MNNETVMKMNKLFFFVLGTLLLNTSTVVAQGEISWIEYMKVVPENLVLQDTIWGKDLYTLDYRDSINGITLQQTFAKTGEKELNYLDFSPSDRSKAFSCHMSFDNSDRLRGYGYYFGVTQLSYTYSEDGRLEFYACVTEDTTTVKKATKEFRYTKDSYVIEFHPNGVIKRHFFFLDEPQKVIEYWPNGKIRIEADMRVQWQLYCGMYTEYDMNGELVAKGNYEFIYSSIPEHRKKGVWKYYKNGKLIDKQKH